MNSDPSASERSAHYSRIRRELTSLVPGTLVKETEVSAYVAGTLPPERQKEVERLLAETPEFFRKIRRARKEFHDYFTPGKAAQVSAHFREELRKSGVIVSDPADTPIPEEPKPR